MTEKSTTKVLLALLARSLRPAAAGEAHQGAGSAGEMQRGTEVEREGRKRAAMQDTSGCDWSVLVEMARKHGVLPLIYEELKKQSLPEPVFCRAERLAQMTVRQNYRLLILTKQIMNAMRVRQIPVVLLKGMGTASFYAVPELRKSGDVDLLLLDGKKLDAAGRCLEELGCKMEEWQPSLHHIVYSIPADRNKENLRDRKQQEEGSGNGGAQNGTSREKLGEQKIEVELHTLLAEPFDDRKVNELLQEQVPSCKEHVVPVQVMGVELPILDTAYHAYELLLHMLQHFLRSGFGLKLLCDWVVFWNRDTDKEQQKWYLELVGKCGIKKFSDLVSLTCVEYLGLPAGRIAFMKPDRTLSPEDFLQEILEAEEFGKSSKDRMVALRGNSLWDYVREFHHQMHLNYPKAGKFFLLWPVLWCLTLIRFLVNNRRIRKTSLSAILKKAGQRGKIMKKLKLFQQDH